MVIIDADKMIVGRLGTRVAKLALNGENVDIINSEKAVVSGKKKYIYNEFNRKRNMGIPSKGPFIHRMPDRILRRMIRGMLPHKTARGREAFKRIMCHVGVPEKLKNEEKIETYNDASVTKIPNLNYLTLGEISKNLGAKTEK